MVNIRLHGEIAEAFQDTFRLNVKSVAEAIHAINILTNGKFNKYLAKNQSKKYQVLVNNKEISVDSNLNDVNSPELFDNVKQSELLLRRKIESIDILPYFELHDSDVLGIVLGAVLVIAGVLLVGVAGPLGYALIVGGLGILAAGVMNLLSKPPKFEDFREIGGGQKASYLFNGPQNTIGEGGPVPVGYGRLIVGSQTISASYDVYNIPIGEGALSDSEAVPGKARIAAINCGSLVDVEGWTKTVTQTELDTRRMEITSTGEEIDTSAVTFPAPAEVYKTAMLFNRSDRNNNKYMEFKFEFGVANASKDITYRLHYAYWVDEPAIFDVIMDNGNDSQTVESNVDLPTLVAAQRKAYIIEGTRELGHSGQVTIVQMPNTPGTKSVLCGIEIFI